MQFKVSVQRELSTTFPQGLPPASSKKCHLIGRSLPDKGYRAGIKLTQKSEYRKIPTNWVILLEGPGFYSGRWTMALYAQLTGVCVRCDLPRNGVDVSRSPTTYG